MEIQLRCRTPRHLRSSESPLHRVPLDRPAHGHRSSGALRTVSGTVTHSFDARYSPLHTEESRSDASASLLSQRLEEWNASQPFQPQSTPLPHVILLHTTYHLTMVFVHRPFYRSSQIARSREKCDTAASAILQLLEVSSIGCPADSQLFDHTHGMRYGHHYLSTTVVLLQLTRSQRPVRRSHHLPPPHCRSARRDDSHHPL